MVARSLLAFISTSSHTCLGDRHDLDAVEHRQFVRIVFIQLDVHRLRPVCRYVLDVGPEVAPVNVIFLPRW